jgi:hypothetical protein
MSSLNPCRILVATTLVTSFSLPLLSPGAAAQSARLTPGRSPALSGAGKRRKFSWGRTVNGLAAGIAAARTRCEADRPLSFSIKIMNAGNGTVRLPSATAGPDGWQVLLFPEAGGKPLTAVATPPAKAGRAPSGFALRPGEDRQLELSFARYAAGAARSGPRSRAKPLPPGAYSVAAVFAAGAPGSRAPGSWRGEVSTGRLRVEVVLSGRQLESRFKSLGAARQRAEKAFAAARGAARDRLYVKYVEASQRHVRAIVKAAESVPEELKERKELGTRAAETARKWLKHQDENRYRAPPEGVLMWMGLYTGRALVCAGGVDKACEKGFDETLKYDPRRFPPAVQPWAWKINLRAKLYKGVALAGARRWKKSLGTVDPAFFFRVESRGRPLGIRARILMARCLGKLGHFEKSAEEFNRAFKEVEVLRQRGGKESGHATSLRRRAVLDMADMVVDAMKAGVRIRAKDPSK